MAPKPASGNALTQVVASQLLSLHSQRALAAAASHPTKAAAFQAAACSSVMVRRCDELVSNASQGGQGSGPRGMAATSLPVCPSAGPAVAAPVTASQATDMPAAVQQLAQSTAGLEEAQAVRDAAAVAAGVRGKIQRLQQQAADKDCQIAALMAKAEGLRAAQQEALAAAAEQRVAQMADARREHEAELGHQLAAARQLAAEKDELVARCAKLSSDLSTLQAECARQIESLRDSVARELRRQKVRGVDCLDRPVCLSCFFWLLILGPLSVHEPMGQRMQDK